MAVANLSTTVRSWLEIESFSQVLHGANTGQVGEFTRAAGNGWTDETLFKFDLSSLAGGIVTSVDIDVVAGAVGGSPSSVTGYIYDQDKTAPGSWTSPPEYHDFAQTPWATTVSSKSAFNTAATHNFPTSTAFENLVQSWIDDSADNWGLICGVSFGAVGYYLTITGATLNVTYTPGGGAVANAIYQFRQRRM